MHGLHATMNEERKKIDFFFLVVAEKKGDEEGCYGSRGKAETCTVKTTAAAERVVVFTLFFVEGNDNMKYNISCNAGWKRRKMLGKYIKRKKGEREDEMKV